MRSDFFFARAARQFLNTCLESDSSMGVLINYKSCASALMPWDRHKVRNCPVTQARGLPHGTAEQQAASRSSGGPATPQTPASAQASVMETLRAPVPAGMWLCPPRARAGHRAGVFPHGKGWRDRGADGGLLWVLAAPPPSRARDEVNWEGGDRDGDGERGSPHRTGNSVHS